MTLRHQLVIALLVLPAPWMAGACSPGDGSSDGSTDVHGAEVTVNALTEAPTGFDGLTNGFATQAAMDEAAAVFTQIEDVGDGLGPVYNRQSCRDCHNNPVVGGSSDVTELRVGHFNGTIFVEPPGGSLIQDRAIDPAIQEVVPPGNEVRALRISLNLFGGGFVEAIADSTLASLAANQPAAQRGSLIQVPVLEAAGHTRAGRFGWKDQHPSLLTCAAVEYLDEIGITTPLLPVEETSNGNSVAAFDHVPDPEDADGSDLAALTLFMRSLKAPPVDATRAATASAQRGSNLFNQIGCAVCHVRSIATAPAGTVINGGAFTVPPALGDKIIHPLCDFLLHNIGTGDGIVQNGGQSTRNQIRTACLWGVRTRPHLMHDGQSATLTEAIGRHANQAATARANFNNLSATSKQDVLNFLSSL